MTQRTAIIIYRVVSSILSIAIGTLVGWGFGYLVCLWVMG